MAKSSPKVLGSSRFDNNTVASSEKKERRIFNLNTYLRDSIREKCVY